MYIPFPLDQVELRAPLPVNVWDPNGVLLLRKGEMIKDEAHKSLLENHLPMVDAEEFQQWTYRYTSAMDKMLRGNVTLDAIAGTSLPMGVEPAPVQAELDRTLSERWSDLHAIFGPLLHQAGESSDFLLRLLQVEQRLLTLLRSKQDDSLFLLVYMLNDRSYGYSCTHALLCSVICHLMSDTLKLAEEQRQSLVRAALTMNIGMSRLHDDLSLRQGPLSPEDRAVINQHPLEGTQLLHRHGVRDETWLKLVRHHHRPMSPVKDLAQADVLVVMAQLLSMADIYVARISPRASRRALPLQRAARDVYLAVNGQPTPLGAAFIKTLGVYIPGCYVKLANGEVGVVVRRGRKANSPMVFALVGRQGMPLGEPALRDTSDPGLQVVSGLVPDDVKVRIQPERLLARL